MPRTSEVTKRGSTTAVTVKEMLEKYKGDIQATMPKHCSIDKFIRVAISSISVTPALGECTPSSLFWAIAKGAGLGLEPNGALGEAYLVPFLNRKIGKKEVQFIPGYRGLISLARRSGFVSLIYADVIKENDKYKVARGLNPTLDHEIDLSADDRGTTIAFYAVYKTKEGDFDFEVMTKAEIDRVRNQSKARDSGPWVDHYEEMGKKTVIKRLSKRMPMSVELATAVELDNLAAMGEDQNKIIDIPSIDISDQIAAENTTAGDTAFEQIATTKQKPKQTKKTATKATNAIEAKPQQEQPPELKAEKPKDETIQEPLVLDAGDVDTLNPHDLRVAFRNYINTKIGRAKFESYSEHTYGETVLDLEKDEQYTRNALLSPEVLINAVEAYWKELPRDEEGNINPA